MVQQDNKPNIETTVDGKPLFKNPRHEEKHNPEEFLDTEHRDDDPLLSDSERANSRASILQESPDQNEEGDSHP